MKKLLLLLLTTFALSCCNKDDDKPIAEIDKLPPATQTGANTVGCLLDGKAFLPGNFPNSTNCFYQFVDGNYYFSREYPVHIVDRVGGGDSFAGGLIYAMLNKLTMQEALEFAVANSCLKHSIEGDHNHVSLAEVKALMAGDGSGRVQR